MHGLLPLHSLTTAAAAAAADESISPLHLISKSDTQQNRQRLSPLSSPLSSLYPQVRGSSREKGNQGTSGKEEGERTYPELVHDDPGQRLQTAIVLLLVCDVCLQRAEIDDGKETRAESDDGRASASRSERREKSEQ